MNIFFLSWDPKICAQEALNLHVNKMLIESLQMLYSVYYLTNPEILKSCPYKVYKLTHKNHPCSIWARERFENFRWLLLLGLEYCEEYTYRYSTSSGEDAEAREHACQKHLVWMVHNLPKLPKGPMTSPAQVMPDKYKDNDPVKAYRNYYIGEKLGFAKYTKREVPEWLRDYI
jgi:hypothetical protein